MKRTLLILKSFLIVILMTLTASVAKGQLLYEAFDYTVPGYIGGNGAGGTNSNNWTTHSVTTGQTTTIDLATGNLSYTGLQTSVGNMVNFFSNANAISRDINRPFTTTNTTVYFSALINVLDNTQLSATAADYFMCIGATAGSTLTVMGARLGIKSSNGALNYRLSICNTSGTGSGFTEFAQDLNFGTTYLVVVKYDRSASPTVASLWVNPATIGGSEPSGSVSNSSSASTFSAFASIVLRNTATTPKANIDEIRVGTTFADVTPVSSHTDPPVATFSPLNAATDVLTWVKPTITFDEAVRKTDGTDLVNADLASLVLLKKTDALGSDVPFTATISTDKKLITVTPTSDLDNSQAYYLAVAPVEDGFGNEATLKSATFTTISGTTPVLTLTNPLGGETLIANDPFTFTWTSANITYVNIEAWVIDFTTKAYIWIPVGSNVPAAAGKYDFTIPADASYGTEYKIRISDASNASINSVSGNFTLYSNATSISDLKTRMAINDIFRLSGEAVVTYVRPPSTKQTYFQDDGAGIMIYDGSALISPALAVGDKFTKLIGKLSVYQGMFEILPQNSKVTLVSTGNSVTPKTISVNTFNTNFSSYESMLVNFSSVSFNDGNGTNTFAAALNYTASDGTYPLTFRTFPNGENNVIGSLIPTGNRSVTGLGLLFSSAPVVSARSLDDINFVLAAELTSADKPVIYPIPAREVLRIRNIENVSHADILDASGRIIRSTNVSGDDELAIPVSDLKKGMYFLRLTTPSGKVTTKFIK